jgi:MFS family permease
MRRARELLRNEPQARLFFGALTQSALGTGAAQIGLLVLAYQRFHSPWAISLVLLADFAPAMVLGPLLGAAADRWSRRWCAVSADVIRGAAFVGIAAVHSFEATLALALLAGMGTALFRPAALAGLPSLVAPERMASATSLYGAITDFGYTVGPGIAAIALVAIDPEGLMLINGVTFVISALVLVRIPLGGSTEREGEQRPRPYTALFREAREGLRAALGMPAMRTVIATSAGAMFWGGVFNVVELPFVTSDLGSSASGYSALVAVFGFGFVFGSLQGSAGGGPSILKRRYLQGLCLMGVGGVAAGIAPSLVAAAFGFGLAGFGNGLLVVHERLLFQSEVEGGLQGRVFAVSDTLASWGFALAFISGGVMAAAMGARAIVLVTGVGGLLLSLLATLALRSHWLPKPESRGRPAEEKRLGELARRPDAFRHLDARNQGPDMVGRTAFWLTLLDDLHDGSDDVSVELRPRIRL